MIKHVSVSLKSFKNLGGFSRQADWENVEADNYMVVQDAFKLYYNGHVLKSETLGTGIAPHGRSAANSRSKNKGMHSRGEAD